MQKQRKSYTAELKAKVALKAIKGQRTVNEIALHYGVHPNQVAQWRKQVLEGAAEIFSDQHSRAARDDEVTIFKHCALSFAPAGRMSRISTPYLS